MSAVCRLVRDHEGMTLAEVLVALPIITIGLLALLAAIPLSTFATQGSGPAEVELGIPHSGEGESMPGMGH